MKCPTIHHDFQPYPRQGKLHRNLNLSADILRQRITLGQAAVYCYVVASIKNQDGRFLQRGSGPNFQGGLITLCTCKHLMRSSMGADLWKNNWIAGFTGMEAGEGRNALVYLMKVAHAFESHSELWYSEEISDRTRKAKATHLHRLGDIFQPVSEGGNPFDPRSYYPPLEDHSHARENKWFGDIDYTGYSGRRAVLLAGDAGNSFLWDRSMMFYPSQLPRSPRKHSIEDLLSLLRSR